MGAEQGRPRGAAEAHADNLIRPCYSRASRGRFAARLLVNRSDEERAREDYYRGRRGLHSRLLPAPLQVRRFALYISGDIVAVMSMERGQLVGVRIDNRHLAENISALFDALWGMAAS